MALEYMNNVCDIHDGPSLLDLIDVMYYIKNPPPRTVEITFNAPGSGPTTRSNATFQINSIELMEGSDQNFKLGGYIVKLNGENLSRPHNQFEAHYSTETRSGKFHIQF